MYLKTHSFLDIVFDVVVFFGLAAVVILILIGTYNLLNDNNSKQIVIVSPTSITIKPGYYPHLIESYYSATCGDINDPPKKLHPCWQTELYNSYDEFQTENEALVAIMSKLKELKSDSIGWTVKK